MDEHVHESKHESTDIAVKGIVWFAIVFCVFTAASFIGVYFVYKQLGKFESSRQEKSMTRIESQAKPLPEELKVGVANPVVTNLPPAPYLQPDPPKDMRIMRERQTAALNSYGWVDKGNGVVHIPIEKAMAITLERSLVKSQSTMPAAQASETPAATAPATKQATR